MGRTAEDMIEDKLRKYPEARNSDKVLLFYLLKEELGWPLNRTHLEDLKGFYTAGTIKRIRAKIQNEYKILQPSRKTQEFREEIQEEIRKDLDTITKM